MKRCNVAEPDEGYTSEDLRRYLSDKNVFLLEKPEYCHIFSDEPSEVPVTYMWLGTPLLELISILKRDFGDEALVWVDIIFNEQRRQEAVAKAVMAANRTYMTARKPVVIFTGSRANYTVYTCDGGSKECEQWDRCWCLLEITLRDSLRKRAKDLPKSSCPTDATGPWLENFPAEVSLLAGKNFTQMQGWPEDVQEICRMLTTEIFPSKEAFNQRMEAKLTEMLSSQFGL